MGDERTRSSTARNALEDRGLNLKATGRIEVLAHRRYYLTPLDEDLAHLRIHDEVDIPLSILKFRIRERVENLAVLLFHNREHPQGLAQERKFPGVDGELACLGDEGISLDSYDVADVEELLEDSVVHCLVLARTNLVTFHIHLNPACLVLQFDERRRAHNPAGHYSSGNADIGKIAFFGIIALLYLPCRRIDRIERSRIRLDSEFAKFPQRIAALLFLFVEFLCNHISSFIYFNLTTRRRHFRDLAKSYKITTFILNSETISVSL